MIDVVGVSLEFNTVRAVYQLGGNPVVLEVPWSSASPERAVDTLRTEIGRVRSISLAVGLGFLEAGKPELPPLPPDEKRKVLLRDVDRYFPLEGAPAITSPAANGVAFAISSEQLQYWIRAFESWAPVRAVAAGPTAIAEALRVRGVTGGAFTIEAGAKEFGLLVISDGKVQMARRMPESIARKFLNGNAQQGNEVLSVVHGKFAAALGALEQVRAPMHTMLLDAPLLEQFRGLRTRRRYRSYALFAGMILLLGAAASARRDKTLRATRHTVDSLTQLAAPALAAQARLKAINEEFTILHAQQNASHDALHVLAALGSALPADAFAQRLEWDGTEWRVDGSVNRAAAVVPGLDAVPLFSGVHLLGASTRFRDGARMRESFTVAFKVRRDSLGR